MPRNSLGYVSVPFKQHSSNRATKLNGRSFTAALVNQQYFYSIDIMLGTPPQAFSLVLDTGSSDIWVYSPQSVNSCSNCTQEYYYESQSSSATRLPELGLFNISYGQANSGVTGHYTADILAVGETSVTQIFGVAEAAHSGDPENGIFGIGLSMGESLVDYTGQDYPGYIDTLYQAGEISGRGYSIFLNSRNASTGTIIFGGYDSSKWTGDLVAFPMVVPAPDGQYRLDVSEPALTINLDGQKISVPAVSYAYTALLDTGSTITRVPEEQFVVIGNAVGAQIIDEGPYYAVNCTLADAPYGMYFQYRGPYGDVTINVPWNELVTPDSGLPAGSCLFGLIPESAAATFGVYAFGDNVLRSMYLLYNFDTLTIGIAQANYNSGESKVKTL